MGDCAYVQDFHRPFLRCFVFPAASTAKPECETQSGGLAFRIWWARPQMISRNGLPCAMRVNSKDLAGHDVCF